MAVTEKVLYLENKNSGTDEGQSSKAEFVNLTDWENEPDLLKLKEDLLASDSAHQAFIEKVQKWNDLMKVEGKAKPIKIKGRSSVQPKLIRRQAEWRYSALSEPFLGSDKLFQVNPRTFEDKDAAVQNELVLNYQFDVKINKTTFIDHYIRCGVDEGSVIVRLGWNRIVVKEKKSVPVWAYTQPRSAEEIQMLEQAIMLAKENPRQYEETTSEELKAAVDYFKENNIPTVVYPNGEEEVEVDKIIDNRPTLDIMNLENVYVDPSCGYNFDKAHFVIVSFETSKAEMLKEPKRYKNLDYVNWENATPITASNHATTTDQNFNFKDELRKRVVAYEYWGLWDINGDNNLTPIVCTWVGDTIVRLELNPFPDQKPPFVLATYLPVKRELMGEPDAELLEDNQAILGAISRGMIDLMGRSANSQKAIPKGMLDVVNRRRYENGSDYEYNPNVNPLNSLIEHKYPEIPQSAYQMLQLQNNEAEALTGVKAFSGGMSGESYGDVAAGIRGALDASSKREMAILRRLAQGVTDIGKKIISMNQEFLTDKEIIRITNSEFITVSRDDIQGSFDLIVDISTAEIDNNKAGDLAFMLQTLGNTIDFSITGMILSEIARLKRMPELAHMIKAYKPEPDPLLVEEQQLKNQKLKLEIAELQTRAQLNASKAEKTDAETDMIDLEKTEQETGTNHERNLEVVREQSKGNANLEVSKALLKSRKADETKPDIDAAIGFNSISSEINKTQRPKTDPSRNINSQMFDPSLDPALNPAINI